MDARDTPGHDGDCCYYARIAASEAIFCGFVARMSDIRDSVSVGSFPGIAALTRATGLNYARTAASPSGGGAKPALEA